MDNVSQGYKMNDKQWAMYHKGTKWVINIGQCTTRVQNEWKTMNNVPQGYKMSDKQWTMYHKDTKWVINNGQCTTRVQNEW